MEAMEVLQIVLLEQFLEVAVLDDLLLVEQQEPERGVK
jgi:hypothetical protein